MPYLVVDTEDMLYLLQFLPSMKDNPDSNRAMKLISAVHVAIHGTPKEVTPSNKPPGAIIGTQTMTILKKHTGASLVIDMTALKDCYPSIDAYALDTVLEDISFDPVQQVIEVGMAGLDGKYLTDGQMYFRPVAPVANKIQAIKLVRDSTKWGLKEAKDAVDDQIWIALESEEEVMRHIYLAKHHGVKIEFAQKVQETSV
jgi:hypothetical protein